MTDKEADEIGKTFDKLFELIQTTDTSQWEDGQIKPIVGPFAINKEKTFAFKWDITMCRWERFMNLLVDKQN